MNFLKRERIVIFIILVLSALLRFFVVISLKIDPISDAASYMNMATTMLTTGHMQDLNGNIALFSAGYPLFLIPFFALFNNTPEVAQYVNVVIGVFSVLLVYLCSRSIFPSWKWASIPALLWATYPPALVYTEYIAKENLMVVLLLLQTLVLLHFPLSSRKTILSVVLGAIFGIQLLVGPAIILTGGIIGIVILNIYMKPMLSGLWLKQMLAAVLGCVIVLSPWLGYTYQKLGTPILNNNGGFNLYLGNNPSSEVYFVGIEDTPMGEQWHSFRQEKGELEAYSSLKYMALEYIIENPGETAWLSLKKIGYFWFPPLHDGKYGNKSTLETLMRITWLVYYIGITGAALLVLVNIKRLSYSHFILMSTAVLYCVTFAAAYIIFRYRLPIMPLMCMLAVSGINFLYSIWVKSTNRE